MPGEFEPHTGCWMLFPDRPDVWREHGAPARYAFAQVATAIAEFEPVSVCALPGIYQEARKLLPPHIRVIEMLYEDSWARDCGPTFVVNNSGDVRGVDWIFNAWGGHYPYFKHDNQVAQKILEIERVDRYRADFVLEGGAIHTDGDGTLLTTRTVMLNDNRNPGKSEAEMAQLLMDYTGVEKIIWIDEGVYEDETEGHIDNLVCFVRPGVVALTWTDDQTDPQYERSQAAYETLASITDARGRSLEIHKIHQPGPLYMTADEASTIEKGISTVSRKAGDRLAGSYINFYIANGGVVVPTFDDPNDEPALQKLSKLFPDRKVVGVPAREVLLGGGNIHCITQQQAAGVPRE